LFLSPDSYVGPIITVATALSTLTVLLVNATKNLSELPKRQKRHVVVGLAPHVEYTAPDGIRVVETTCLRKASRVCKHSPVLVINLPIAYSTKVDFYVTDPPLNFPNHIDVRNRALIDRLWDNIY